MVLPRRPSHLCWAADARLAEPPPWSAETPPSYPADASETGTQTQEERERKSKGKVLVSGTHGSIPSASGLILHKFFRAGQVHDLDTHRHTHTQTHTHIHRHTQTHTEPGKPCITGCHQFPKKLTRACPVFNKDRLTVLHFSPVFKAILIF